INPVGEVGTGMAKALQPSKWAEIRKLWKEANSMLKTDSEVAVFWKEHKRDADKIQLKINELKLQKKNRRNPVAVLFQKAIGKELRNDHDQIMPVSIRPEHNLRDEETQEDPSSQECEDVQESTAKITRAYKQVELQKELDDTNETIVTITDAKRLGLCNDEEICHKLKQAFQKRDEVKNYLKRRRNNQLACIRARKKRKDAEKQNLQNPNTPAAESGIQYKPPGSSDLNDSGLQDDLDPAECITEVNYEGVEPRMHSSIHLAHVSEEWKVIHVRQSQYTLPIVKCTNHHCCRPPVTNLTKILPERFLSAPILYQRTLYGIDLAITDNSNSHFWDLTHRIALHGIQVKNAPNPLPFEWFFPSLKETVISRTCTNCGIYFPSKIGLTNHRKMHLLAEKETLSHIEVDDTIDFVVDTYDNADNALVIDNLDEWYSPVFIEVETGAN
ncbi:unnamed protein product, partial [Allacma fusca]